MVVSLYFFFIKKINKFGFAALGLAVFLLAVALIVPLSFQHEVHENVVKYSKLNKIPSITMNASHIYMVNIIFASILSVGAIAGTVTHFAAQQ